MRILVTGGAGFIGSHISERLLDEGHTVTVLDSLDPYYALGIKRHNLDRLRDAGNDQFSFVEGSVTDESLVQEVMQDIEFVYHEAAQAGVRTSVQNPKKPHTINTTGLLNVLLAASDAGVTRVVNASSSSVYGRVSYLPFDEDHPTRPLSPYAVTKLAAEHYCNVWNDLYDLPTVNLRYFTVYGPRMRPNMAITNFTFRCLNGHPPVIYGDGEQTRDFTYIDDIVTANLSFLESSAADGETVNVGSSGSITINELADHVIDVTNADVTPVHEDSQAGDTRHTKADISKAADLIDYDPSVSIRSGVSQFVDWYEANREWYEPLVRES